jgi:hypothetical protein
MTYNGDAMGLQENIRLTGALPSWTALRDRLEAAGLPVSLRMIDGQLALPDEAPEPGWQELRLALPAGMVTLRHTQDQLSVIVWGNADAALLEERDRMVTAIAKLTGGTVSDVG